MAGVKGMKGCGGARPGAGRKKKVVAPVDASQKPVVEQPEQQQPDQIPQGDFDMLELLQNVALGKVKATPLQVRAAIAAVQYTHTKRADGGKKEELASKAKSAGNKFAASAPPKLVVNNRK